MGSALFLNLAELLTNKKTRYFPRRLRSPSADLEGFSSPVKGGKTSPQHSPQQDRGELGGPKDNYLSWSMIKAGLRTATAHQSLQALASAANNPDLTKPLSDKALQDLPDFILLELHPQCRGLSTLVSQPALLSIESLLPSKQYRPQFKLTWFKIVNYYMRLLRRCHWQKGTLQLPDSDWGLYYNHTTPFIYAKAKAVLHYLSTHCSLFKPCLIPSMAPMNMLPSGGSFSTWMSGTNTPHREPHLAASETDVTIVWFNNPLPPPLQTHTNWSTGGTSPSPEAIPPSDRITGYFAMNLKPVNFPLHSEPHLLGVDVHMVHTSLRKLSGLHQSWKELSGEVSSYMESRANMRPTSRSPSKQKRAEKNLQPPEVLIRGIAKGVKDMAEFFDSNSKEVCQNRLRN